MQLKLLYSRLHTKLIRSSLLSKFMITGALIILALVFWWFSFYQCIVESSTLVNNRLSELIQQKSVFDDVQKEYRALMSNQEHDSKKNLSCEGCDGCRLIIDLARECGLDMVSYTKKPGKSGFKQMNFSFEGRYDSLIFLLQKLDRIKINISCKKLKLSHTGYRLQITYVCGIHTSVKA